MIQVLTTNYSFILLVTWIKPKSRYENSRDLNGILGESKASVLVEGECRIQLVFFICFWQARNFHPEVSILKVVNSVFYQNLAGMQSFIDYSIQS